jgi:predicted AlkP superfamily phosphohydrolase/phosphomutase
MDLPKVNIAVIGVICSSLGGMVWYASEQASIIANLEETVAVLDAQNNQADKTNLIRDVEQNTEQIDEIIEYIIEVEEDGGDTIDEIYSTFDDFEEQIYEDLDGVLLQFNQIVKLQARVKTLENTLEFLARRPTLSDGR